MDCGQVRERLSCYLDGELDEALLEAIEAHLEHCERCRQELDAIKSTVALTSGLGDVDPPEYLSAAIKGNAPEACRTCLSMLSEYIDGELSESDASSVEAHISTCSGCAKELAALQATTASIAAIGDVDPPAELRSRIAAATTGRKRVSAALILNQISVWMQKPKVGWSVAAAAAAAVIAVGLWTLLPYGWGINRLQTNLQPPSPPPVEAQESKQIVQQPEPAQKPIDVPTQRIAQPISIPKSPVRLENAVVVKHEPSRSSIPNIKVIKRDESAEPETAVEEKPVESNSTTLMNGENDNLSDEMLVSNETDTIMVERTDESGTVYLRTIARKSAERAEDMSTYFGEDAIKVNVRPRHRQTDKLRLDVISTRF